jgi:hypothetical protein
MEEMTSQSGYDCGPYVVLDDNSTYSAVDGATVCYLTVEGQEMLEENNDFQSVGVYEVESVSISDLLDAYNKVHGTNL